MKLRVTFDVPSCDDYLKIWLFERDSIRTNLEFEWGDYYSPSKYCVGNVPVDSIETEVIKKETIYES